MDEEKTRYYIRPHLQITWRLCHGGDWSVTYSMTGKPPNKFHRLMMRLILGIHSKLVSED